MLLNHAPNDLGTLQTERIDRSQFNVLRSDDEIQMRELPPNEVIDIYMQREEPEKQRSLGSTPLETPKKAFEEDARKRSTKTPTTTGSFNTNITQE